MRRLLAGLRTRILVAFLVLLALSTGASVLALRQILIKRTGDRVERGLAPVAHEFNRLSAQRINPLSRRPFNGNVKAIFNAFFAQSIPDRDQVFLAFVDGRPYRFSPGARPLLGRLAAVATTTTSTRGSLGSAGGSVRYLAVPVRVNGQPHGVFAVAGFLGGEYGDVDEAVRIAIGVSIITMLLATLLVYLVVGRALTPLHALAHTARRINETDLSGRIPVTGKDEMAELARTFNAMLDRLETAFGSQKNFISDVSHELRTPITIIRGHIELLEDTPEERRATVALVEDELDRMSRLLDDMLLLARAQRPDFLRLEPLDLDVLTEEIFAKVHALGARDWRLESVGVGPIHGDRQRITQAIFNLAQNAVQHTRPGEPIALGSALSNGDARLWVRDTGPGVDPRDRESIFKRYSRGGANETGVGLGLAIVTAIAEAHGGRVELESDLGSGSQFTLVVPRHFPDEGLHR